MKSTPNGCNRRLVGSSLAQIPASAILISVDRDLLDMKKIQAIPIIRPGEYWRRASAID
jgi:hypothetical protein